MVETIFVLTTDDVKLVAQQMGIDSNRLTRSHYYSIKKGVESGLENWAEVMKYAIQAAVREEPISSQENQWQSHAENLTEHSARDYERYYREQGYEVKVVPSKRYRGRFDFYVKRR